MIAKFHNKKSLNSGFTPTPQRRAFGVSSSLAERGFTLIEIIVGLAIFVIVSLGVVALVSNLFTVSKQQSNLLSDQDAARKLQSQMLNEIRNMQTGSDGSYPLAVANNQEIVFFAPVAGQPGIARVHYILQNGQLKKGLVLYANNTYATSTETFIVVENDIANSSQALFNYYDDSYTGQSNQSPLTQPVNVTLVRYIQMNLQIYDKAGVKNNSIYTVTAGAAVRNLKDNLGS